MYAGSSIACEGVFMNVLDFFFTSKRKKEQKKREICDEFEIRMPTD